MTDADYRSTVNTIKKLKFHFGQINHLFTIWAPDERIETQIRKNLRKTAKQLYSETLRLEQYITTPVYKSDYEDWEEEDEDDEACTDQT